MAQTKTFQSIFEGMAEHVGLNPDDRLVQAAAYMAAVELRETIREIIGPDDMSEAAQRIRAKLRKM